MFGEEKKKVPLSHSWACGVPGLFCGTLGTARPKPRPVHAWTRTHTQRKTLGGLWWSPPLSTGGGEVHAAATIVTPASRQAPPTGAGTPPPPICRSAVASTTTTTGKTHAKRKEKENVGTILISHLAHLGSDIKKRHGVNTPSLVLGWGFLELRRMPRRARPSERPQNDVLRKH